MSCGGGVEQLTYPIIIKATDLQGSRGICIVRDESSLLSSYREVMSLTHKDYCIVEEFITGTEFGAQAFVYHGDILFVLPHGDETIMCKTAVPVGHYMPYEMNSELAADVDLQALKAIMALGLDNCAVNIDFIERDNKAYVIELTGRGGANGLTDITGMHYGINYYEMIIKMALGNDPNEVFNHRRSIPYASKSEMIKSAESGIVKAIKVPKIEQSEINLFITEGSEVRRFTNCNDAIGEVFVYADTQEQCCQKIDEITSNLTIELL
jgi:biotin carboxylase